MIALANCAMDCRPRSESCVLGAAPPSGVSIARFRSRGRRVPCVDDPTPRRRSDSRVGSACGPQQRRTTAGMNDGGVILGWRGRGGAEVRT